MCLYEKRIINPKYLPSEKNNGQAPECRNYRQYHITIGCGHCEECRKEAATDWRIRLQEEYKTNRKTSFVTLSFSPKSVAELEREIKQTKHKGIQGEEIDVNILASFAVRRWSERWRKKYGKSPKHWLITELGHERTCRLHLHGIVWNEGEEAKITDFKNQITNTWKYGNVYNGEWVNEATINYIIKYVTKIDKQNLGYKAKTLTSKGIGKDYITRSGATHQWAEANTIQYYLTPQGWKCKLPRYYKNKLWNEEQRELLWQYNIDKEVVKIKNVEWDKTQQDDTEYRSKFYNALKSARDTNKVAGYGDNNTVIYKYIVTDLMKMEGTEIEKAIGRKEMIKKVERRKKEKIILYGGQEQAETEEINKGMFINHTIMGEYKGTTTETERKKNQEMQEAKSLGVSVRELRLIKKGIITNLTFKYQY